MFNDVSKYVETLCGLDITANQFLLCYLLYVDEKKDGKYIRKGEALANLYKYASHNKGSIKWTREEIRDLCDKGYLEDPHYHADKTWPDHLIVRNEFKDKVFASKTRFQQFNELYPALIPNFNNPNGPKIKLKVCDIDEIEELYDKKVKSKAHHEMILEVVKWAKDNNQLNTSMENFVRGNLWQTYKQEMLDYKQSTNMSVAR